MVHLVLRGDLVEVEDLVVAEVLVAVELNLLGTVEELAVIHVLFPI